MHRLVLAVIFDVGAVDVEAVAEHDILHGVYGFSNVVHIPREALRGLLQQGQEEMLCDD